MIPEEPEFISSVATEQSKPWPRMVTLGQQIVRELGAEDSNDTLTRWIAHRIAELMERAETEIDADERRTAQQQCISLILQVWARRCDWPHGQPLAAADAFLNIFRKDLPPYVRQKTPENWEELLAWINDKHDREIRLIAAVALAETPIEHMSTWLREAAEEMEEDERRVVYHIVEARTKMNEEYYLINGARFPLFGKMTQTERQAVVLEELSKIHEERKRALAAIGGTILATSDAESAKDWTDESYEELV